MKLPLWSAALVWLAIAISPMQAQQTRSSLSTFNNAYIKANGQGQITGPIVNSMFGQTFYATGFLSDDNPWSGTNRFNGPVVINGVLTFANPSAVRTSLGAAASGANGDITSLSGLTTPLSILQGGSGLATQNTINLKQKGGVPDLLSSVGCSISVGSNALYCPSAAFTLADVGKHADVSGAGGANVTLSSVISGFVDAQHVTLSDNAVRSAGPDKIQAAFASTSTATQGSLYVNGDTVVLAGGTGTEATTIQLTSTQVNSGTIGIVSPGTGGVSNSNCQFSGTTGTGVKFVLKGVVSAGGLSSVTSLFQPGRYTVNPTALANEPVTSNCSVTGAVVSLQMTPLTVKVTVPGSYSVAPTNMVAQASTSGTGTGATFNMNYYATGNLQYGTDNGTALIAAVNDSNANYASKALPLCIYAPGGIYGIWSGTIPTFLKGGCVYGDGINKSHFYLGATFSGNLFSWSEAWVSPAASGSNLGPQGYISLSSTSNSPVARDFSVSGDTSDPNVVTVLGLYDHDEEVDFHNLEIGFIHGPCIRSGELLFQTGSYTRESYFQNIRCYFAGTKTVPAILFTADGSGAGPNELRLFDINVFAPAGVGFELSNGSSRSPSNSGSITFHTLRVEGFLPFQDATGDLFQFGNPNKPGRLNGVTVLDFLGNASYPGYSAIGVYNSSTGQIPFSFRVDGRIGSNAGGGVDLEGGRLMQFNLAPGAEQQMFRVGPSTNVVGPIVVNMNGQESTVDNVIDPSNANLLSWRPLFGWYGGAVSFNVPNGSVAGGAAPATGGVDLTTNRVGDSTKTATGLNSYITGGFNNTASGVTCGVQGQTSTCAGQFTNVEGFRAYDRNRYGVRCRASGFITGIGDSEYCDGVMRVQTTSATPARLLTDGSNVVGTNTGSCWTIAPNYSFLMDIYITAKNITTAGNSLGYHVRGLLSRDTTAASTTWTTTAAADSAAVGSQVTASNVAISADATNACINIAWTAPNMDTWVTSAGIYDAENGH